MSSWVEIAQRHKNNEKFEIKEKLMELKTKIKRLELSFKDTLETLDMDSSFIPKNNHLIYSRSSFPKQSFKIREKPEIPYENNEFYAEKIEKEPEKSTSYLKPVIRESYKAKTPSNDYKVQEKYKEYLKESSLK